MHEKDLSVSLLMDFYGEILTQKQQEVIRLYYDEDLSLAEIAQTAKITRQGVRDCIKRGETTLREMENKLKLAKRFSDNREILERICRSAEEIQDVNSRFRFSGDIGRLAGEILSDAESLFE